MAQNFGARERGASALFARFAGAFAVGSSGGIQASADFRQHVLIDPRAVPLRTGHSGQSDRAGSDGGFGGEADTAIRAVDLFGMPMAHLFDQRPELDGDLFAQRLVMNGGRVRQSRRQLHQRFLVTPRAVMIGTGHAANADRHPRIERFSTSRTMYRLHVLAPQLFQQLSIASAGPLILPRLLDLKEFVTKTVFF